MIYDNQVAGWRVHLHEAGANDQLEQGMDCRIVRWHGDNALIDSIIQRRAARTVYAVLTAVVGKISRIGLISHVLTSR